jgi:drug/metabolite transporter (DMT)-like permease
MLGFRALSWLVNSSQQAAVPTNTLVLCGLLGLAAGGFIYRGFSRIAARNLRRIGALGERPCLFAFQSWKSYVLIAVMMTLGLLIRRTSIPRHWLAVLYLGLAVGLAGSSLLYFQTVLSGDTARGESS